MTSKPIKSIRFVAGYWFAVVAALVLLFAPGEAAAQVDQVEVVADDSGARLQVNGEDFFVFGINWDYFPIGENYAYSLWTQPDDLIRAALDREMTMLQSMGVNAIRQYVGVTPRWVEYIYENYGIYTVLNHALARYGVTIDGTFIPDTDYSDPRVRAQVISEVEDMVREFKDTPGVLMWLLGNENNYGLVWSGAETENLPAGERDAYRARFLYSLFGEATEAIHALDTDRPVAMANGDLQYIDIIAEEASNLDVFGTNVYRGISFGDLYQEVKDKLDIPVMLTEFGADAWNAKDMQEDQMTQARYLLGQWQEIYEMSAGKGLVGNSIGGLTFQWTDGWWKYLQESNLDVQDTYAGWANDAYAEDYVPGQNNMNEEWWGIVAKGPTNHRGLFELYPRAAFYALQLAYALDPYAPDTDLEAIRAHFASIPPATTVLQARGDNAARLSETLTWARLSNVRMEFETFSTGGKNTSTPPPEEPQEDVPSFQGFDHLQSFYTDFEVKPTGNMRGTLSLNILGNVPLNPIDEVFYENRGRRRTITVDDEPFSLESIERVKVYSATVSWDDPWFQMEGFYRVGRTHWGYEGDFFGIRRDSYYGDNLDIYNGVAPSGFELSGKKALGGLKVGFGPELWWGANPALLMKYRRQLGSFDATAMYHEEFARQTTVVTSFAIPLPTSRRVTLAVASDVGPFDVQVGGIWAGSPLVGRTFQITEERDGETVVLEDQVKSSDTWGGKAKITWQSGRWNWYAQYAYAGVVANSGPDATRTFTGWHLKDIGAGNGNTILSGLALNYGNFQFAPNFLWQKPLVGPISSDVPAPGRPRNVVEDPFAVRANREAIGGEFLLTYDPTPATWMWAWDNIVREDAPLAWSLGIIYRHFPTTMDAAIGILPDGRTFFAFPGATPARDLWEVRARVISRIRANSRMILNLYGGTGEPNGDDARLIYRYGGDLRYTTGPVSLAGFAKFGDWGPYDYHRDFNQTFPVQLIADLSYTLGSPDLFGLPQTSLGVRVSWRSLNKYSPRYCPIREPDASGELECNPDAPGSSVGNEWEIRTYLHVSI